MWIIFKFRVSVQKKIFHRNRDEKPIIFLHNIAKNMKHIEIAVSYLKMILGSEIDLSNKEIIDKIKKIFQ